MERRKHRATSPEVITLRQGAWVRALCIQVRGGRLNAFAKRASTVSARFIPAQEEET